MARVDFYKFYVYEPYKPCGECHRTLREAKQAYIKHLRQGHRVGCDILGCTLKDDSIFLTYTSWYNDEGAFGRTELSSVGYAVKYKI